MERRAVATAGQTLAHRRGTRPGDVQGTPLTMGHMSLVNAGRTDASSTVEAQRTDASSTVDPHRTDTSPAAAPSPPPDGAVSSPTLRVVAWRDPLVDTLGFDPRSLYAEHFWLPVIGPTATWLLRRLAARFEREENGFVLDLHETSRSLGLGGRQSPHSPFARAVTRCVAFGLARRQGHDTIGVRRMLPPLSRRHLIRLPQGLQEAHRRWTVAAVAPGSLEAQRRRARRLALGLIALGESLDGAQSQLLRWGVHPALTGEATVWARRVERTETLPS